MEAVGPVLALAAGGLGKVRAGGGSGQVVGRVAAPGSDLLISL